MLRWRASLETFQIANNLSMSSAESTHAAPTQLARRLGLFDATMLVMGGIIGSGIFMNPSVVARQVSTPFLILGVWALGG